MTVYGKGKKGLAEELRELRTHLSRLERKNTELMQIQEMLQESVNQFKTIFNNTLIGLYRTTPDGQILMANSALLKMLGYSSFDQLAQRNLEQGGYEPQYLRSEFKERIESEGKIVGMESAWKKSDGTTLYVRESAQAIHDESGSILYYQGTVEDITEHKQMKIALQSSEEMFKALVANMSEGVDIVDENLRCMFANPAGEEIFGVESGGLLGRSLREFISSEGRSLIEEQLSKRRKGIGSSYDLEIIRPDGRKRQLIVSGAPRFSENGKYLGAMAIFFDVTKRKESEEALRKAHDELEMRVQERTAELQQANEALRERELSLNLALQVAQLGHWDWHIPSGRIVCSDEIYRMFGVQPEQFQSTYEHFFEFVHPSDRESLRTKIQVALLESRPLDTEFRIFTTAGQERILRCRAASFKDQTGEPLRMIGTTQDITEHREADRQMRERAKIIDSTTDSVVKTNRDGIVTMWNRGSERIFGYTSEEMIGQPISTIYPEQEQGRLAEIIETLSRGEEIATTEVTCVHKNGSLVELALSVLPLKDDSGNVIDFVGISKDISDRKKAQEALLKSENRYRTVIENAGEGIVVVQDGMLRFVNSRHTSVTGRSQEESMSRPFIEFVHPDDRQRVAEVHTARLRGELVPSVFEFRIIDKNGRTKWLENNGVLIEWNGKPASLNFLRDITASKNAKEALREREEMIRALVETSRDWIWSIDLNGVHTYCNPAVEQILGYSPDELVGKRSLDLIHNDDRRMVEANLPTWIAEKRGWSNLMVRWKHKDGTYRYLESNAVPILSSENKLVGFRGIDRDITGRKRAEESLRESEERFRKVFEEGPIGMVLTSRDLKFFNANPAFCKMLGYTAEEMSGKTFLDVTHPAHRDADRENVEKMWRGEIQHYTTEKRYLAKNSDIRWGSLSTSLIRGQDGEPCYALAMVEDITEHKRAEEALQASEARYADLYENAPDMFVSVDAETACILSCNRTVAQTTGYDKEEIIGKPIFEMYHPDCMEEVRATFQQFVATGEVRDKELQLRCKDGSKIEVSLKVSAVRDASGKILCSRSSWRDITERKRMEEELRIKDNAIASSITAIAIAEFEGKLTYVNNAFLKMWGYDDLNEVLGKSAVEFWNIKEDAMEIVELLREGNSVIGELVGKRKDGSLFYAELSASSVTDEGGVPVYMMGSFTDITERKKAQEALRESENRYRTVIEHAGEGIAVTQDGIPQLVNPQLAAIAGCSEEEIVSRPFIEFVHPDDRERVMEIYTRRLREQELPPAYELRIIDKQGTIKWMENNGVRIEWNGRAATLNFLRDVTDRKQTEEALKESEEKFRSLAEQSPNMIFINKKGRIVYINNKCEEVMGYTKEELCSPDFDFRTLVAPESLNLVIDNFARHLRGEDVQPYDYTIITKNGKRIEAINSSKLIHYEGQTAVLGVVTDITERKRSEQALRESEERLKILFESAPDTIYLIDSEGRFVDGNKAAFELIGFARDEVIGKSLAELDLLSAEQLSKAEANLKKVVASKLSGPNEYILKRKDGRIVSVEVRTFPVKIGGEILTLGIARDVTEHKRAEKKLLEYQAELKSLASQLSLTEERERYRLATDLHDQISQSLVISKIKLDQLCKSSISNEIIEPLGDISKCLGQIIDDTRALTFDLSYPILYELGFEAAVAEWLIDQIQEKHGIKTEFVDDGHNKPLDDDIRVLLFRNVRELLINVVKHARAHKVSVAIHKVNKHIRVSVEDDGIGFDPVEVASMAAKRAEFGLFSIRERLEQLGGQIEINSGPGRGSKITMIAPLKYDNSPDRTENEY
jgi:PAS domain S-box-containing protein